jgi:hypothetical protein
MRLLIICSLVFLLQTICYAQAGHTPDSNRRLNIYVVNKIEGIDFYSRTVLWRAQLRSVFKRNFSVVVAHSSENMANKVKKLLARHNAMIGTLWFDSHGKYVNGYSSFRLGDEEFSFKTIKDSNKTKGLRQLASFCDDESNIVIGSCYGGATYEKPASKGKPASRMNGDSLIMGLAAVLPGATVYGTEGWVMTKPGIFLKHTYALAGFPLQKRFKDIIYEPVWMNMGIWHSYSTRSQTLQTINTIALTGTGAIHIKADNYLEKEKYKKRQQKNLSKLRPNVIKNRC